jgi:DNA-binding HxlR family transcriptional regulator
VRCVEGLSTKVLNSCLKRNVGFGILQRVSYNEMPPGVEYNVPPFGRKFIQVPGQLEKLARVLLSDLSDDNFRVQSRNSVARQLQCATADKTHMPANSHR